MAIFRNALDKERFYVQIWTRGIIWLLLLPLILN